MGQAGNPDRETIDVFRRMQEQKMEVSCGATIDAHSICSVQASAVDLTAASPACIDCQGTGIARFQHPGSMETRTICACVVRNGGTSVFDKR